LGKKYSGDEGRNNSESHIRGHLKGLGA